MCATEFRGGERINFGDVHQRFDRDFFAFGISRPTRGTIVYSLNPEASEHRSIRAPENSVALWRLIHDPAMVGLDRFHHGVIGGNGGARNRDKSLEFEAVLRKTLLQLGEKRFGLAPRLLQRHVRRYT